MLNSIWVLLETCSQYHWLHVLAKSSGFLQVRPAARKPAPPATNIREHSPRNTLGTLDSGPCPNTHEKSDCNFLAITVLSQARDKDGTCDKRRQDSAWVCVGLPSLSLLADQKNDRKVTEDSAAGLTKLKVCIIFENKDIAKEKTLD